MLSAGANVRRYLVARGESPALEVRAPLTAVSEATRRAPESGGPDGSRDAIESVSGGLTDRFRKREMTRKTARWSPMSATAACASIRWYVGNQYRCSNSAFSSSTYATASTCDASSRALLERLGARVTKDPRIRTICA